MGPFDLYRNAGPAIAFAAGQTIFSEGDAGEVMYVVKEGEVEIRRGERVIETHGPGNIFGEMAIIEDAPRSADAVAKTDVELVPINQRRFMYLVQQTPYFAIQMMEVMSARLRRSMAR
jgi:CRP-like cAMP-binding protein